MRSGSAPPSPALPCCSVRWLWRLTDRSTGPNRFATGTGTGDSETDVAVAALINSLTPPLKLKLAQGLAHYHASTVVEVGPPLSTSARADTATMITAWVDVECTGSRELVIALDALARRYSQRLAVDVRGAPRGTNCKSEDGKRNIRCIAAAARVCAAPALKDDPLAFDRALFAEAATSPARIRAAASALMPERELDDCLANPKTVERVVADRHRGGRPPSVVIAGRRARTFSPLLELLLLTRGEGKHPALATLPNVGHDRHD